ncbi:chorismate transformation enzyme, FkbO/Hyg5 family [Variovorax ginsengisoli]|uniref:Enamine deaminase RidA (YjgF/YER057c/UK114 family) n=1 Tax=Variovorax ginsengisoli TaxID=363844 RepID=A0ABT9SC07_9BURK|nr:hypothetical protein [Variovorax ginsengisoli]MDP9901873.1 enamine deaminase RidA (YjgF/YER057c/UK114 family) [Variovorax ginsengisoli]
MSAGHTQPTASVSPLRIDRLSLPDSLTLVHGDRHPLGALGYGTPANVDWMPTVDAQVLLGNAPCADILQTRLPITAGTTGCVRWRSDGHWMLGTIDLDEGAEPEGLAALAERAYRDLFQAQEAAGCPHLQRVWNYLPQINGDGGGLERYRQFNLGRQRAFLAAGRAAFEGAPAACALGIRQGALSVRFLAGRHAPLPVENPRQVSAYRYPPTYGPSAPTFSRAALSALGDDQVALFISGTASIVGHETLHAGDVQAQTRETLRNLSAVIDAAHRHGSARFALADLHGVVYIRHAADAPAVQRLLAEAVGETAPLVRQAVFLEADVCRQDLLVEIEAHAVSTGTLRA